MSRGEATRSDDLLLLLERHGYGEECYFTFSYSPIRDESGGMGGVFTPVAETSEKVIGARRLQTLQELATRSRNARDVQAVCVQAAETLSRNPADIPFSAIYLYDQDRTRAERVAETGMAAAGAELPATVLLNGDASDAIRSPHNRDGSGRSGRGRESRGPTAWIRCWCSAGLGGALDSSRFPHCRR